MVKIKCCITEDAPKLYEAPTMYLVLLSALEYSSEQEDKVPVLTDGGRGENQQINKKEI